MGRNENEFAFCENTYTHIHMYVYSIFMRIYLFQVHLFAVFSVSSAAHVRNVISVFT